jgi:hypothetical protein
MPSLLASAFGFAAGIANADKIDITTNTHAARLIKNRRRIGPSFMAAASCDNRRMFWRAESSLVLWPQQPFGPAKRQQSAPLRGRHSSDSARCLVRVAEVDQFAVVRTL